MNTNTFDTTNCMLIEGLGHTLDVIFPKPVKIPQGKVIFPDNKITSRVNPGND